MGHRFLPLIVTFFVLLLAFLFLPFIKEMGLKISDAIRLLTAMVFVTFVPGFLWSYILLPTSERLGLERVVVSVGFSFILVVLCVTTAILIFQKLSFGVLATFLAVLTVAPLMIFVMQKIVRRS